MPINPNYNTKTFADEFSKYSDLINEYAVSGFTSVITDDEMKVLWALLYSKYGNSPIINLDENQWKYKIFRIIFSYGKEWSIRKSSQNYLKSLTKDDIIKGVERISNYAANPSVAPGTSGTGELGYVDSQSVNKTNKSILGGYQDLFEVIDSSEDDWILSKFAECFSKFASKNITAVYVSPTDEEED